jgi:hypothetical protein
MGFQSAQIHAEKKGGMMEEWNNGFGIMGKWFDQTMHPVSLIKRSMAFSNYPIFQYSLRAVGSTPRDVVEPEANIPAFHSG